MLAMGTIVPTVEKLRGMGKQAFLCAVDVDKAYDSVARPALD